MLLDACNMSQPLLLLTYITIFIEVHDDIVKSCYSNSEKTAQKFFGFQDKFVSFQDRRSMFIHLDRFLYKQLIGQCLSHRNKRKLDRIIFSN